MNLSLKYQPKPAIKDKRQVFTGIISSMGTVSALIKSDAGVRLTMAVDFDLDDVEIGASISHAGCCLTVVSKQGRSYDLDVSNETLSLTNLGAWKEGSKVNIERALKIGDELGGHIVSGHVDGKAEILQVTTEGEATRFRLAAPEHLARFVAPKGSVCLDGTSLTVNAVDGVEFDVLLIRHSLAVTTWGQRVAGDFVNFEVDTMARYAARLAEFPANP